MIIYYLGYASNFFDFQDCLYIQGLKNMSVLVCWNSLCPSVTINPEDILVLGRNSDFNMLKSADVNNGNICTEKYVRDNLELVLPEWNKRIPEADRFIPEPVEQVIETPVFPEEPENDNPLRWVEW